jgi:hypothetical protein
MKTLSPYHLLGLTLIVMSFSARGQSASDQAAAMKALVESGNYVFKAQTAMPLTGRVRTLTDDYTLKVSKESVVSDLPFFGQAYAAPMDPSKTGLQFTSKKFDYTATPRKKGGWDVLIKPRDYNDVQQLVLTISTAGYASLQVTSTSRQAISFNGIIVSPDKK